MTGRPGTVQPAPFDYRAPASVPEAVDLLAADPEACVLAGGQSLLVELRYRRRAPDLLVDVNRIPSLARFGVEDGALHVGALVRHAQLERARFADPVAALLRATAPYVAHPPVRSRGTFAGSLAWADPAAEWNALAVALDAEILLRGPQGDRAVAAGDWFTGPHETAREAGELVTGVRLPLLGPGTAVRFTELRRTHGSFPLVAVVVTLRLVEGIAHARIALAGAGPVPVRARRAEELLRAADPSPTALQDVAERAASETAPVAGPHASVGYRRQAVAVLVRRSLAGALEEARGWT